MTPAEVSTKKEDSSWSIMSGIRLPKLNKTWKVSRKLEFAHVRASDEQMKICLFVVVFLGSFG